MRLCKYLFSSKSNTVVIDLSLEQLIASLRTRRKFCIKNTTVVTDHIKEILSSNTTVMCEKYSKNFYIIPS